MVLDTKAILLDEAEALFAARGYDAVAVQEIVAAAGVTKPTLYHHFGSKRGLLDALLHRRFASFQEKLEDAAGYDHDLTQALEAIVDAYTNFAQDCPRFFRLQRSMSIAPPDSEAYQAVAPYLRWQKQTLEQLFIDAVPDHGNLKGHHQLYALTLLGMVLNVIDHSYQEGLPFDDALVRQTVKQFMHGIYAL